MDRLSSLPEESLSEILQRTSPADASRFAMISKRFKSAADSDIVWDRFLPSDWPEIVSRSVSPVVFASKKELYLSLSRSPILINAGKLSFSLEKKSGKKCYMVGARELTIIWSCEPRYWDLTPHPDSRFAEVARLKSVCWLEIRSVITMRMLSSNTIYGAYLVFKLADMCCGLESAIAFVRFTNDSVDSNDDERNLILGHIGRENGRDHDWQTGEVPVRIGDGLTEVALLHLQQQRATRSQRLQQQTGKLPVVRGDGWMEVEMGSFYCDRGDEGMVETWFTATNSKWKSGLIVQGIEFRPKP